MTLDSLPPEIKQSAARTLYPLISQIKQLREEEEKEEDDEEDDEDEKDAEEDEEEDSDTKADIKGKGKGKEQAGKGTKIKSQQDEEDDESESETEKGEEEEEEEDEDEDFGEEDEFVFDWSQCGGGEDFSFSSNLFLAFKGYAFFPLLSTMNHSCEPNCVVAYLDDSQVVVFACRDIAEGEELTISYVYSHLELEERRNQLKSYGFVCMCEKCMKEEEEERQQQLEEEEEEEDKEKKKRRKVQQQ